MVKTVFLGSPAIALPSLRVLAEAPEVALVGVVAQPARPAGRRRRPQPCPVAQEAARRGLPLLTPERIGEEATLAVLRDWGTELAIVCAYGQIFPAALLELPRLGCYNLHFSLLPRWRGASPVQAALLAGDATTGVSLQRMAPALDAGDLVAETPPFPIRPDDTAASLGGRLAEAGAALLGASLGLLAGGDPPLRPQHPAGVTRCRLIRKEAGAVDFAAETAGAIERKCRAFTPWPGCYAFLGSRRLELVRLTTAEAPPGEKAKAVPGTLAADGRVPAREGWLRLEEVKPEGKVAMSWAAFRNGRPEAVGARLTPAPV
jgi:methionyl-tRNA formyltransferase